MATVFFLPIDVPDTWSHTTCQALHLYSSHSFNPDCNYQFLILSTVFHILLKNNLYSYQEKNQKLFLIFQQIWNTCIDQAASEPTLKQLVSCKIGCCKLQVSGRFIICDDWPSRIKRGWIQFLTQRHFHLALIAGEMSDTETFGLVKIQFQ